MNWKVSIFDEDPGKVTRILRPDEARGLIDNLDIEDDKIWPSFKHTSVRIEDISDFLQAALFTGMRIPELAILRRRPDILERDGNITLPFYPGGKEKRTVLSRVVYLSDIGVPIVQDYLEARPLPLEPAERLYRTLSSLDQILHASGERTGLETKTFTKVRKKKVGDQIQKIPYQYKSNGCLFSSFRKTWESWLFVSFQSEPLLSAKIYHSMGHTRQTAEGHYLNYRFDVEDIADIQKMTKGWGVPKVVGK